MLHREHRCSHREASLTINDYQQEADNHFPARPDNHFSARPN